MFIEIKS